MYKDNCGPYLDCKWFSNNLEWLNRYELVEESKGPPIKTPAVISSQIKEGEEKLKEESEKPKLMKESASRVFRKELLDSNQVHMGFGRGLFLKRLWSMYFLTLLVCRGLRRNVKYVIHLVYLRMQQNGL